VAYEGKKPKDEEERSQQDGNPENDIDQFIFSISSVDVVFFDKFDFLYTSSPIPDFIMT